MEVPTDHQASAAHWGLSTGGPDDLSAGAPPHLPGESYFHPAASMDGTAGNSYYNSRAVHGYRSPHSKYRFTNQLFVPF